MKNIFLIVILGLCSFNIFSQTTGNFTNVNVAKILKIAGRAVAGVTDKVLTGGADSLISAKGVKDYIDSLNFTPDILAGGPITSLPQIGNNPGTNITTGNFIRSQFYGSQTPTASLTGGGVYEFAGAGTFNSVLSWTAGRQGATATLVTVIVDGISQTFTQPAQPGTISGTKTVIVTNNTNISFTNVVTTTDSKTATANVNFAFSNKIYAGFILTATPSDADIISATNSANTGGYFAASKNQSGALSTPASSKYIMFAAPASFGVPSVTINGLGVLFDLTTRNFVNSSGFTSSYIIAVSPFPTGGDVASYVIQ